MDKKNLLEFSAKKRSRTPTPSHEIELVKCKIEDYQQYSADFYQKYETICSAEISLIKLYKIIKYGDCTLIANFDQNIGYK